MPLSPRRLLLCASILVGSTLFAASAIAYTENKLHVFKGGTDGAYPRSSLLLGSDGTIYGTTGGGGSNVHCSQGCGTVFKLPPDGKVRIIYAFQSGSDGAYPQAGLIADAAGNMYGTTSEGGSAGNNGTVFEITPGQKERVLYAFQGSSDGGVPAGGLVADSAGNLYGVTAYGGDMSLSQCDFDGCGTVFKVAPDGTETVLYAFQGNSDGIEPTGGLVWDSEGNLYGATSLGGTGQGCNGGSFGCGTIFRIASDKTESVLYTFQGGSVDGNDPNGDLVLDGAGSLYGTITGGAGTGCGGSGCGGVFKLTSSGSESTLHAFQGSRDGATPFAGVIADGAGNLYGTTYFGGSSGCDGGGCGTAFEIAQDGTETVLFDFRHRRGKYPAAGLTRGSDGTLYGSASEGGKVGDGVVFSLTQ